MKRIMIIGCSGSGKSTLGRRLAGITGLPLVHTDHILWKKGWELRQKDEIRNRTHAAVEKSAWIFEGANSKNFDLRIARADTLIVLDLPAYICLFRVLKRVVKTYGKVREDMAPGCPERFDWGFLKWIYNYRHTHRPRDLKMLEVAPVGVTKYHFKDQKSVENFLSELSKDTA